MIFLLLTAMLAFSGCAMGSTSQLHTFPAAWPSSLERPSVPAVPSSAGGNEAVQVELFALDLDGPSGSSGPVLTDLFADHLRAAGVRVSSGDSRYLFRGVVPQLGYVTRSGYPRRVTYFSRLVYQLVDRQAGQVVWTGNLEQEFEQTVLVNTMTRLPSEPNPHEKLLLEKCVEPIWDSVAKDVGTFLEKGTDRP